MKDKDTLNRICEMIYNKSHDEKKGFFKSLKNYSLDDTFDKLTEDMVDDPTLEIISDDEAFEILQESKDDVHPPLTFGLLQKAIEGDREAFEKIKNKEVYYVCIWTGSGYGTINFYKSEVDYEGEDEFLNEIAIKILNDEELNKELNQREYYSKEELENDTVDEMHKFSMLGNTDDVYVYEENFEYGDSYSWNYFITEVRGY